MSANLLPYLRFLPYFLATFFAAVLLTPWIGYIARKFHIIDLPGKQRRKDDATGWRRIHTEPKLKMGGLAVILPFFIATILFVPQSKELWGLLSGITLLTICGVLDDIFDFSAKIQSIFHLAAACLIVLSGLSIQTISNPFGQAIQLTFLQITIHGVIRYLPAVLLTVFWIFFIINAVKWVSGSDGLVEGNGAIAAIMIGLISVRFQTYDTALMGFALAGGFLGLLLYNFYPSKILSGSSGKSVYGFILAVLAIYSGGKLGTFVLILSLPIIDALWVILYRIRVHHPKTLFQLFAINDKSHIHHRLLDLGLSQKQVAIVEYLFTLCTGMLAFFLTGLHKALAVFAVITFIMLMYLVIGYFLKKKASLTSAYV